MPESFEVEHLTTATDENHRSWCFAGFDRCLDYTGNPVERGVRLLSPHGRGGDYEQSHAEKHLPEIANASSSCIADGRTVLALCF